MGALSPAFRGKKGGQNILCIPSIHQVSLAPYDSYAEVAYFGVPYSATLKCYKFLHLFPSQIGFNYKDNLVGRYPLSKGLSHVLWDVNQLSNLYMRRLVSH